MDEIHYLKMVVEKLAPRPPGNAVIPGMKCRELMAFERKLPVEKALRGESEIKRASSCYFKSPDAQALTDTLPLESERFQLVS